MTPKTIKLLFLFVFFAPIFVVLAVAEEKIPSYGIAPLRPNEGIYSALEKDKKVTLSTGKQSEISIGAVHIFDIRGDINRHRGWGGTAAFLFSPPIDAKYPNLRAKAGVELLIFHSNGAYDTASSHTKESLDAGAFNYIMGLYYVIPWEFLERRVEVGAQVGFGLGGTLLETREDFADGTHKTRQNGNINWAMQVHPRASIRISEHSHLNFGYRFGFITPILRTEGFMRHLTNYRTVDIMHHSVEASISLRF